MNNKIKDLAEQAGCCQLLGLPSDWDDGDYVASPKHIEKFAELIVQECAKIACDYAAGSMPLMISLAIKEKFGVK